MALSSPAWIAGGDNSPSKRWDRASHRLRYQGASW